MLWYTYYREKNRIKIHDNGKLFERIGRKASGLKRLIAKMAESP